MSESESKSKTFTHTWERKRGRSRISELWERQDRAQGISVAVESSEPVEKPFRVPDFSSLPTPKRIHASQSSNDPRIRRIRTIPRGKSFKDYCEYAGRMQPPILSRREWIKQGCPPMLAAARKDKNFRRLVYDEYRYHYLQK
jgi:hypothetical protein